MREQGDLPFYCICCRKPLCHLVAAVVAMLLKAPPAVEHPLLVHMLYAIDRHTAVLVGLISMINEATHQLRALL
jgi:hypothetical protein